MPTATPTRTPLPDLRDDYLGRIQELQEEHHKLAEMLIDLQKEGAVLQFQVSPCHSLAFTREADMDYFNLFESALKMAEDHYRTILEGEIKQLQKNFGQWSDALMYINSWSETE